MESEKKLSEKTTISLNFRGMKKHQIKKIDLHDKRGALDTRNHKNKNIIKERSRFNITLIDKGRAVDVVDSILENGYNSTTKTGKPRKIKHGANYAVTAVVQLGGRMDSSNPNTREKVVALKAAHDELVERFGEQNVIHSGIHLDESNPHLHFSFVPLTADGKLSMKATVGDRQGLTKLQEDFLKSMQERCEWADFDRKEDQSLNGLEQSLFEKFTSKLRQRESKLNRREFELKNRERNASKKENENELRQTEFDNRERDLRNRELKLIEILREQQDTRARLEEERQRNLDRETELDEIELKLKEGFEKLAHDEKALDESFKNVAEAVKKVSAEVGDKRIEIRNREEALDSRIEEFNAEKSDFVEKQKIKASELVKRETRVNVRERAVSEREDNLNNQITEFEEYKSDFAENVKIRASELDERERGVKGREDLLKAREDVLSHQIELFNVSKADLLSIRDELENQMIGVKSALNEQRLKNNAEIDEVEEDLEAKERLFVEKLTRMNIKKDKGNGLEL